MWAYNLTGVKIAKIANFFVQFWQKGVYPLKPFLPNLAWVRESQVRILVSNFTVVALKIWAYRPQNSQIGNFWYKFAKRGYTPYAIFFLNLAWERESQIRTLVPNFIVVALKRAPKEPLKSP